MELIYNNSMKNTTDVRVSKNYIVGCTGQRLVILDKYLNHLKTLEKLKYVYYADISPDEKHLLFIANGQNGFSIMNLEDYSVRKINIKLQGAMPLESGKACFSCDGKSIYVLVRRYVAEYEYSYTIRKYSLDDIDSYEDFYIGETVLHYISRMEAHNKYIISAYDSNIGKKVILIFDGETAEPHIITDPTLASIYGEYEPAIDRIIVYGPGYMRLYSVDGELIEKGSPDYETAAKIMKDRESVLSSNGKYYYVPTKKGFHILNTETQKIEKRVSIEDGVDEIIELSPSNIVVFVTGGTTKLYSIVE